MRTDIGIFALEVPQIDEITAEEMCARIKLKKMSPAAVVGSLNMLDQYSRDINDQGVDVAPQDPFLVE